MEDSQEIKYAIEWHQCEWPWQLLLVFETFFIFRTFQLLHLGKCGTYQLRYDYTWIEKCTRPAISTVLLNLKDFSRSQAVTYIVRVVIILEFENGAIYRRCYDRPQTGSVMWPIGQRVFRWHWMTFEVMHDTYCTPCKMRLFRIVQQQDPSSRRR